MSLTLGPDRPLSSTGPNTVNYRVEGPRHRLFFGPFPRRIRAFLGGELVLDSVRAMLLHESNLMVVLYVPREDVLATLTPAEHTTHCPFKGDASYWDVAAGGGTAPNAVWGYLEPLPEASWLAGYVALYWDAMDAWFDEDEETGTHPRDPYTRIDVRRTSRPVEVSVRGEVVAETRRALVLSEGHLPNRFYIPRGDVVEALLEVSATHTYCPYKGEASYLDVAGVRDGAWYYPEPYDGVRLIGDHLAFHGEDLDVRVAGELIETGMPPRSRGCFRVIVPWGRTSGRPLFPVCDLSRRSRSLPFAESTTTWPLWRRLLPAPLPLTSVAGLRLNEAALHGWDVRVALDPAATVDADTASVLIEHFAGGLGFLLGFIGKADHLAEPALVGIQGSSLAIAIQDQVSFSAPDTEVTATLKGDPETVIRLIGGRLTERYTPADVEVTGNVTLADLRRVFPGY